MLKLNESLTDRDLLFISDILISNYNDKKKLLKILREDEEILDKMLSDKKLLDFITKKSDFYINISPLLLFSILLRRLKIDLTTSPYTEENKGKYMIPVFDSKKLLEFLNDKDILNYLAEMLASFSRINSYSTMYRIRKGIWRRLKISDFDIDSLVRYSRTIEEKLRFKPFKKIADICLFILGIFPEYIETHDWPITFGDRKLASIPEIRKLGFESYGKYYYKTASTMDTANVLGLNRILNKLSDDFDIAEKALQYLTNRFLPFKKNVFPIK